MPVYTPPIAKPASDVTVQVIIPFRDQPRITQCCLDTLLKYAGRRVKVTLVNNDSQDPETLAWLKSLKHPDVSVIDFPEKFNFSTMMNLAVERQGGDYAIFANNDLEFFEGRLPDFIETGLKAGAAGELGALGGTLLYPNNSLQHLFVAPGVKLVGAHPLRRQAYDAGHAWYGPIRQVPAVSGAIMMVNTAVFQELGGFDKRLATAYQDVDYCLRVKQAGYKVLAFTRPLALHHESFSRKKDNPWEQMQVMYERWGTELTADAQYPLELTRWSERPLLRWWEGDYPVNKLESNM